MKTSIVKKFSFLNEKIVFKYIDIKHDFPKHIHDDTFMIGIAIKGKTIFIIENEKYDVHEDQICIIPPKLVHFCTPSKKDNSWKFLNFHISKNFLQNIANNICEDTVDFLFKNYFIKDSELSLYLKNLIYNTLNTERINEEEILNFLTMLLESHANFSKEIKEVKEERFKPLFDYLKKESYCLKSLDFYKMAEIMDMNPYYFHRTFSKTIGLTPQTFINSLRLSKATELLEDYDSLAQVALQSGFYDQAYFTKQFKKQYGITPKNFRKIS
jgi:AraC-like DNA-binding protein